MQEKDEIQGEKSGEEGAIEFRWKYIFFPINLLVLAVILVMIFYTKLPMEPGYTFGDDGFATRTMDRIWLVAWLGGTQIALTLSAVFVTRSISSVFNKFVEPDSKSINPELIIMLMGNMIAIPQGIVFFAMLDIFSYNSYETHLLPLWLNALIFLVAGGVILGIFFLRIFFQIRGSYKE